MFVLVARFIGSVGMFYVTSTICCFKRGLTFKEVVFLNFSGVIRGAIAFGLVLRLDGDLENRSVIITTVLTLVIATTIIFGALMTTLKLFLLVEDNNLSFQMNKSFGEQEMRPIKQNMPVVDNDNLLTPLADKSAEDLALVRRS